MTYFSNEEWLAALDIGDPKLAEGIRKAFIHLEARYDQKMERVVKKFESARDADLLNFADQAERADYHSNLLKSCHVLLTGE